jgi:hypothetical protein
MSRSVRAALLALAMAIIAAGPAWAHAGNPNYRSVIDAVTPRVPGLKIDVVGYDTPFQLVNHSGKTVTIYGYGGEPYERILPDGTVQENRLSPAVYLNTSDFETVPAPSFANSDAPPQWKYVDKTGSFAWHDHRMHWMGAQAPPQVKDKQRKTKIFDYRIPMSVGHQKGRISGTLFWVGSAGGGPPVAAIVSLIAVLLLGTLAVVVVRRRREASPAKEAW